MRVLIFRGLMIAMLALVVSNDVAFAGPLEDAQLAYYRGDYETALRLFRPLAEQGNAVAQDKLGSMYANGRGVPQDDKEAIKWYRLAAKQDDANAQANLGIMYANGRGVPHDDKEASRLYRLGAQQGNAVAQNNLGSMYQNGLGVRKDYDEAIKWFRLAAQQGEAYARTNLGVMYEHGYGVPKNDKEALKWYRLAAAQGGAEAQTRLGVMYETGRGVPEDYVLSYMWLTVGNTASDILQTLTFAMTPAQIDLAQKMAKRCVESNYQQCGEPQVYQFGVSAISVPMQPGGGIYVVPVLINDAITLDFVVDSGAADVSIPADVVSTQCGRRLSRKLIS